MTSRDKAPLGAPCWADLWTSDVDSSRHFYSELFGWEALEPSPEFGGYFMFNRKGVPVAGGMGDMGDMKASNTWKIYLDTDDINRTVDDATKAGATIIAPASPVADLDIQFVLLDPNGADLGAWQPGTFPGFTVLDEPGAPSWFELHTRNHAKAVKFYHDVFRWEISPMSDTDDFRYSVMMNPSGEGELAGIFDASSEPADQMRESVVDLLAGRERGRRGEQGRKPWGIGRRGSNGLTLRKARHAARSVGGRIQGSFNVVIPDVARGLTTSARPRGSRTIREVVDLTF